METKRETNMKHLSKGLALALLGPICLTQQAQATSFEITNGQTVNSGQTLAGNEQGIVDAGGTLSTGATTAVTASGAGNTVTNAGTISTTTGSAVQSSGATATISNSGTISSTGDNTFGIVSSGANTTVTNSGTISATGTISNIGIRVNGTSSAATNSGTISTTGSNSYGIYALNAALTTISNSGTIGTSGAFSYGLYSTGGAVNTISNSGTINTSGSSAYGIYSTGTVATISNSGTITSSASGIRSEGAGATISNSGSINMAGGAGIESTGDSATISNSGTIAGATNGISTTGQGISIRNSGSISLTGASSYGITATAGANATISNSGSISLTGTTSTGINVTGSATISNSGSISTSGTGSYGVFANTGVASKISNSGSMNLAGDNSTGIFANNAGATISNSGSINTSGATSAAIQSNGLGSTINNSGSLSATGSGSSGIYTVSNTTINNSGTISATGSGSYGIKAGNTATINNSGTISATGSGAYAILGANATATSQTLNLLGGSRIYGIIDLGDSNDGDVVNVYGTQGSAVLNLRNVETVNVYAPNAVAIGTTKVVVVEPTGESTRGASLGMLTQGIHNVINQRGAGLYGIKTSQVAAAGELTPDMVLQERRPVLWAQAFGAQGERAQEDLMSAYKYSYSGFVAGYERELDSVTRAGFLGGVATGQVNSSSQRNSTDSLYAGVYADRLIGQDFKLGASLVGGQGSNSNQRDVLDNENGMQTARAQSKNYFISPSFNVSGVQALPSGWELRPAAQLVYSLGVYEGYTESGTTGANMQVSNRRVQAQLGRMQLEGARKSEQGEWSLRAGWQQRRTWGEAVTMSIDGYSLRFNAAGSQLASGPYIGTGAQYQLKDRLHVLGDIEYARFDGSENLLTGRVSLQYLF
jgi:hypothetical protein